MKQTLSTFILFCLFISSFAQAPQGIPYQSIIRNGNGNLLINQSVQVRFTIHDSTMNGNIVYQETHATTTSATAMLILTIGLGNVVTGNFSTINWGNGAKFMQVELEANGGNNYIDLGTQQMMSVPFALYAGNGVKNNLPVVSTDSVFNITNNSASIASHIINDGGATILLKGICWGTSPNPTISLNTRTNEGPFVSSYISNMTNLVFNTTYYVRSYSVNTIGISYGNEISFSTTPLAIGNDYGGGKVAYILQLGDAGYIQGEQHGLIAEQYPIPSGSWGCYGTNILGADGTLLGSGQQNTLDMITGCPASSAAEICNNLVLDGYSDWYLPSKDELYKLYLVKTIIGYIPGLIWTSSEYDNTYAYALDFTIGNPLPCSKNYNCYILAVRSF